MYSSLAIGSLPSKVDKNGGSRLLEQLQLNPAECAKLLNMLNVSHYSVYGYFVI